jgi:hypothetical protein
MVTYKRFISIVIRDTMSQVFSFVFEEQTECIVKYGSILICFRSVLVCIVFRSSCDTDTLPRNTVSGVFEQTHAAGQARPGQAGRFRADAGSQRERAGGRLAEEAT